VSGPSLLAAGCAALLTCTLALVVLVGGSPTPSADATACVTSGPIAGLTREQAANARTIVAAVSASMAGAPEGEVVRAETVALMTAFLESRLRDLANPTVPGSADQPGASGSGTDHDSVGLFQQRASWGSAAQRMDPMSATRSFLARLLAVPGWEAMPAGLAAQAVQNSAHPDAYAQWESDASSWLAVISHLHRGTDQDCGGSGLGSREASSLPVGFMLPASTSTAAAQAVTFALAQLGKPYVWDAAGPDSYDCSGLTMAAWASAGVSLPHSAAAQARLGTRVATTTQLTPGDLVFIPGADGTFQEPGHVGMYIGSGLIVEAPDVGELVKLVPLSTFGPIAALRHFA
jgi:cell wall-associated NlpC family hydrolase